MKVIMVYRLPKIGLVGNSGTVLSTVHRSSVSLPSTEHRIICKPPTTRWNLLSIYLQVYRLPKIGLVGNYHCEVKTIVNSKRLPIT